MKQRTIFFTILLTLFVIISLIGCNAAEPADPDASLTVLVGESEVVYTRAELEALGEATVDADGNTYVGVPLADLLRDAGADPATVAEVTAVASDGFSAAYDSAMILNPDTLVAYGTSEGDLSDDEQPYRMVLPDQPGRMNVRMLARIEAGS